MKISIVAVMSMNGKITRGSDSSVVAWASKADANSFKQILAAHSVYIMGSRTFEAIKPKSDSKKSRVILTHKPDSYSKFKIPGQIEFTDDSPDKIIKDLTGRGYDSALVLGGSQVYGLFLEAGLVDDIYLTVEPLIFGSGTELLSTMDKNLSCKLVSSKVLNEQGSLLLHYKIIGGIHDHRTDPN